MRARAVWLVGTLCLGCGGGGSSPTTPGPAPTPAPTPTPTPAASVVRSAAIGGANGHSAAGTADIVRDPSNTFTLEMRSDFRIDSGRNDVYLTRSPGGIAADDLNLGDMKATSGAQSYPLPNDGSAYRYVMLWCRPFQVPIGLGELR